MDSKACYSNADELGLLIATGNVSAEQINLLIETHGHAASTCVEICCQIWDRHEVRPLELLIENNLTRMTLDQCLAVHDLIEEHFMPEDQSSRAKVCRLKLKVSTERGLFSQAASDLRDWLDEEFLDGTFAPEELYDQVVFYSRALAEHETCSLADLVAFVSEYHHPGSWRQGCDDHKGFESCARCQAVLKDAPLRIG